MANSVSKKNYPQNVGIIMDGNGRWAMRNSLKVSEGHKKGVATVKAIVEESVKNNIKSLTIYAFSSENWKRPKAEVNAIKRLVVDAINDQVPELKEQKVRLKFFGDFHDFEVVCPPPEIDSLRKRCETVVLTRRKISEIFDFNLPTY